MYFQNWEELKKHCPVQNGFWQKDLLKEYLIQSCNRRFTIQIDTFMARHREDEALAQLLFHFLLNEDYDGSDCQIGAARYIARLDRGLLQKNKVLLLQAQQNNIRWKRPFPNDETLEWLIEQPAEKSTGCAPFI